MVVSTYNKVKVTSWNRTAWLSENREGDHAKTEANITISQYYAIKHNVAVLSLVDRRGRKCVWLLLNLHYYTFHVHVRTAIKDMIEKMKRTISYKNYVK